MMLGIDFESSTPIYLQLREQIVKGIATKRLAPGDSLPSVRQLASDLGINLHTVNKAYAMLKQEGFITLHRQKGAVINSPDSFKTSDEYLKQLCDDLEPMIFEALLRGINEQEFSIVCSDIFKKIGGEKS